VTAENLPKERLDRLCDIMTRLRSPDGCPWDAEQTSSSLKPFIIEEAYELIDAIDEGNPQHIKEELGDLLLQIVFQTEIYHESGLFTLDDVIACITEKLIRRHPHVFSSGNQPGAEHHELRWDRIKADEKSANGQQPGLLSNLPSHLPALQTAQKIYSKLRRHARADQIIKEINESSCDDSDFSGHAPTASGIAGELYRIVMKAELNGIDAETALRDFNNQIRLGVTEQGSGRHP